MRNPQGYAVIVSPEAGMAKFDKFRCEEIRTGTTEIDTFQCVHCSRVMHVKPKANMDDFGSMCRNCMKMTCPTCANGPCTPFMKKIEMIEERDRIRRMYEG